jgi:hypothetical protein
MLSGNHRRYALRKYLNDFAQQLKKIKAGMQKPVNKKASHDARFKFKQLAENQNIIRKVISDSGVEGKVWRMTASGL